VRSDGCPDAGLRERDDPATWRERPERQREQVGAIFQDPCRFERWPQIPIHVIASANDRFFPLDFQQRVARDRIGKDVDVVPGGHLVALSHPDELVDLLLGYFAAGS
jgi:pimeloyl-ACP methyl ester carboxylesterase